MNAWGVKDKDKLLKHIILSELRLNLERDEKKSMEEIYEIAAQSLNHSAGSCKHRFNTVIKPTLTQEEIQELKIQVRKRNPKVPEPDSEFMKRLKYTKSITQSQSAARLYRNTIQHVGDAFEALIDEHLRMETVIDSLFADLEEVIYANTELARENQQLKLKLEDGQA